MNPKGKGYGNWAGVNKNPWECKVGMGQECLRKESEPRMPKERKWAKDVQGGRNGPRKPVSNGMGQGSPSSMNAGTMTMLGHCN